MAQPTVLILAAGENSRFFPLNQTTHKGALTLLGVPIVVRALQNLELNGFEHVVIAVSQKDFGGKGLSGFLAEYSFRTLKIDFVLQPESKGMGDAILCCEEYIEDAFAVVFPTTLDAGDALQKLISQSKAGGAMRVSYTKEPWLYGIVTVDGQKITSIIEKPAQGTEPSNLKAHEMYYLSHEFIAFLKETAETEYAFEAALDRYFKVFEVSAVEQTQSLPSLKYSWHLFDYQKYLFESMPSYVSPYATVAKTAVLDESKGHIYIENGATIGHAVKIVGPTYIGKDVFIGDFSLIRASSFEEGSSVGVHSDVTRSIIMERSSMHNGFLGDSIVGRKVKIGASFISSNRRMDRGPISVQIKEKVVDTGFTYLGTVIGDEAKLGIRVSVMPGKFVGCRSIVYPNITIWQHLAHDSVIKLKQEIEVTQQ